MPVIVLVVLLAVAAGALAGAGVAALLRRRRPHRAGDTVIVNTPRPDDQSIRGVVVRATRSSYLLEAAEYLNADGTATPIGGRAYVPHVAFVQDVTITAAVAPVAEDAHRPVAVVRGA